MRDSQRSKVYKSDHALDSFGRLETVPEIEAFVSKLWHSERFKKRFPVASARNPRIGDGRRRRRAGGNSTGIWMPRWARSKGIVCHELAHCVQAREFSLTGKPYGFREQAAHGWEFCSIYLEIVRLSMGREAHDALKLAFKKNRVRFREPRRLNLTPEERAAIGARLSVYRAPAAA